MRIAMMRIPNMQWIAVAIISLFTHVAIAQGHQDLAAVIAGGNTALSEAVYGLHTTAYYDGANIQVAGQGQATTLDVSASNFSGVNFSDNALNGVNTVIIRYESAAQVASLDAASMSAIESLTTVVLLFTYDITAEQAATAALTNVPAGATSYYSISIPE